jgi:hypothetical protein
VDSQRQWACFWLIIKTFIYLLQLKPLLNIPFLIFRNRRIEGTYDNQGLFQTLEKFQSGDLEKNQGFAEPEIFLGFEIDLART